MNPDQKPHLQNDLTLVPALLGPVFQAASAEQRSRLLAPLLQPLGLLALVAVARGIFARRLLSRNGRAATLRPQDTQDISAQDVVSLAQRVQQVNAQALCALVPVLLTLGNAAATELAQRLLAAQAEDNGLTHFGNTQDFDSMLA